MPITIEQVYIGTSQGPKPVDEISFKKNGTLITNPELYTKINDKTEKFWPLVPFHSISYNINGSDEIIQFSENNPQKARAGDKVEFAFYNKDYILIIYDSNNNWLYCDDEVNFVQCQFEGWTDNYLDTGDGADGNLREQLWSFITPDQDIKIELSFSK